MPPDERAAPSDSLNCSTPYAGRPQSPRRRVRKPAHADFNAASPPPGLRQAARR